MIGSFRSKTLEAFWSKRDASKLAPSLRDGVQRRLRALDAAKAPEALNIPGFDFHPLLGKHRRCSIHLNGPWCITFEWSGENAEAVDLENHH